MKTKNKTLYKFLRTGLTSDSGNHTWKIGEWYHEDTVDICNKGFHASQTPLQALRYVGGEILAHVEVKGKSVIESDKECWSDMRIVKAWYWRKEDSVALAICAAELCIENFEKVYPNDKRPREAIEAAKTYLANPTTGAAEAAARATWATWAAGAADAAAWAAGAAAEAAARAAWAAEAAAWSADGAAGAAARAAEAAARAAGATWAAGAAEAARAAEAADWAANTAAWAAAWSADGASHKELTTSLLDKWFMKHIKELKEYEG